MSSVFIDPQQAELGARMGHGQREGAAVRLIRAAYLVELDQLSEIIKPRQELPDEAFHDGPIGADHGVALVAISYPWLTAAHPDPERFHMKTLAPLLAAAERDFNNQIAVFLDFMSLFQGQRTTEQNELFKQGLRAINLIYGHQQVTVWCLTRVPAGVERDYHVRGWCTFERAIASALKTEYDLLDIGMLERAPDAVTNFESQVEAVCKSGRRPPLPPAEFQQLLLSKHFTNGKQDHDLVSRLYADFVAEALGAAVRLTFPALEWGDTEAHQISQILVACTSLTSLSLSENNISDDGVAALAAGLNSTQLEELDVAYNKFGARGAAALAARLPPTLRVLNVEYNQRLGCPVLNARTRKGVEQFVRFFAGEGPAVRAEVKAATRAARERARCAPPHVALNGQLVARRLHCVGRGLLSGDDDPPSAVRLPLLVLTCRLASRGAWCAPLWRCLDPYRGPWTLSEDEPLIESAPHYERRLPSGVTKHLFVWVNPSTRQRFWGIGPMPGVCNLTAMSRETDASTPVDVAIWDVYDGAVDMKVKDAGFAFVDLLRGRATGSYEEAAELGRGGIQQPQPETPPGRDSRRVDID